MMAYRDVWKTFVIAWKLYQQYSGRKLAYEEWAQLLDNVCDLHVQSGMQQFVEDVLLAVVFELERYDKETKDVK